MTLSQERERMVNDQLIARGITDERVLAAMRHVPRHCFVDPSMQDVAYADQPLPIGEGQTISQPYIVALMSQALRVQPGDRILEIGTGSGYQAAILAELGAEVHTLERIPLLAELARVRLERLGYTRVHVHESDGNEGWPEAAPYDAVIVTAAAREIPRAPLQQLKPGGRMVLPIGDEDSQELVIVHRGEGEIREDYLGGCRFVKLVGRHGWET